MQVNPINTIKQNSTQSKYTRKIAFKNTEFSSDTFESQKKDSSKKVRIWDIIGGAMIVALSVGLIYQHQNIKNIKSKMECLDKAKDELTKAKTTAEESLKKEKEESGKRVRDLEDKVQELENKIKNIDKKEEKVVAKPTETTTKEELSPNLPMPNSINEIANDQGIKQSLSKLESRTGLSRVLGYTELKQEIITKVINPINSGADNVPNLVLLYGPKGCGKTTFLKAIKEACECNNTKLYNHLNTQSDLNSLQEAIRKAEENYQKNGKHTILYIDEVDGFLKDANSDTKHLINNLAKDNHCTIVATTNYPKKINSNLIPDSGFEQFYVGTASKENIEEILKFYLPVFSDESINYSELISILQSKGEYSNAKITGQIKNLINARSKTGEKLTHSDFVELFNNLEPDISKEVIDSYKK